MKLPIVYHCEADVELVAAAKRYKCQRAGLGREFLRAVHLALARIQKNPEVFPVMKSLHAHVALEGFLIGSFTKHCLTEFTLAIAHSSREPGYWRNRLS